MKSRNFEFIRKDAPELADLGGFAERYAHTDPSSALIKLRLFGETLLSNFYYSYNMPREPRSTFLEDLQNPSFKASVPTVVVDKLHALRIQGNQAAHGDASQITPGVAIWIMKEAFDLGKWLSLTLYSNDQVKGLAFQRPPEPAKTDTQKLKKQNAATLQKLADQEEQMKSLLAELEETRAKAATAEKTKDEEQKILTQATNAASTLEFDEAETRKYLIDHLLVQAGWNVAPDLDSNAEVVKELQVKHQPTPSGIGYADYVLFDDDGKPLAVVEAKKTSSNPEIGRTQAKCYADGLEKEYGQRPVIFYTNGYEVYLWDDAKGEVPRCLFGFYSKDSLRYCLWKTRERITPLEGLNPDEKIINRLYQIEAVKRVANRLDHKRRKALIVQATGTGKTRVSIALCKLLTEAKWAKRILFLCDRRELRKQANNAFGAFFDSEPRTYVTSKTSHDRKKSIYLATYPAMMKCFESFDVGFFDLIVADESHRSIYNRYRELFRHFDAIQIGLTATPLKKIARNTYQLFECEDGDPTSHYSFTDAIDDSPSYLAPFRVVNHTTKFLRDGIKYSELTPEQQQELEEQIDGAEGVDFEGKDISRTVHNKDTDRKILRNLMENGIRNAAGTHIGKTIIFARSHIHAVALLHLFEEMYPQYMKPKKEFCTVIDNYEPRAEQLIDDFKGDGNNENLTIAISVDMLDTGIDVPAVVNLVFAKPIKSYVKFWQMIGRGTRLCENLFGPGKHKEFFQIFDHWGNFEYFGEDPLECDPASSKSILQKLFELRIDLAEVALEKQDLPAFHTAVSLLEKDVQCLPMNTIAVKEKWKQVKTVQQNGTIKSFDAATVGLLKRDIAPLMQWCDLNGHEAAYRFDCLVASLQRAHVQGSGDYDDHRFTIQEQVSQLPVNLSQVAQKIALISEVKDHKFWERQEPTTDSPFMAAEDSTPYADIPGDGSVEKFEHIRRELRGIMHCRKRITPPGVDPLVIDVTDSHEEYEEHHMKLDGLDLAAYKQRVKGIFTRLFDESSVLQKIKHRRPVSEDEINQLADKVHILDPNLYMDELLIQFPNRENRLDLAIRQIVGLDAEAVNEHFGRFVQKYPTLSSHQLQFLNLIKKQVATYGILELERLYESPFTQLDSDGVDGIFTDDKQVDDLLVLITEINELTAGG